MYTICIIAILIASICLILAVLVQSPKSGMAANFGASNQVMGVRETANFLEKFTWTMAIAIVVLSLVATLSMDSDTVATSNESLSKDANAVMEKRRSRLRGKRLRSLRLQNSSVRQRTDGSRCLRIGSFFANLPAVGSDAEGQERPLVRRVYRQNRIERSPAVPAACGSTVRAGDGLPVQGGAGAGRPLPQKRPAGPNSPQMGIADR